MLLHLVLRSQFLNIILCSLLVLIPGWQRQSTRWAWDSLCQEVRRWSSTCKNRRASFKELSLTQRATSWVSVKGKWWQWVKILWILKNSKSHPRECLNGYLSITCQVKLRHKINHHENLSFPHFVPAAGRLYKILWMANFLSLFWYFKSSFQLEIESESILLFQNL